jgi:hypothetical protein
MLISAAAGVAVPRSMQIAMIAARIVVRLIR